MLVASSLLRRAGVRFLSCSSIAAALLSGSSGCNRLREHVRPETVYVVAKQTYLRDRVAAVSNRVALVTNGEPLEVVEHGRRFLKAKTSKGEVGWIEDHMVVNQATYDQFAALQKQHAQDPVVATGVLRDDLYLHLKPGRESDRFFLLPENEKLQLLIRASVPKPAPPQGLLPAVQPVRPAKASAKAKKTTLKPALPGEPAVPMEDWWLVRNSRGQVGWLLSRRMDVDVPDEIAGYSEGQRIVGAYVLTRVYDPDSSLPDKLVPEYVWVTNAYKDGLPYDFNQVRVFTWNVKKHRYETAYRQRDVEGYLPVVVSATKGSQGQTIPGYSITVAASDAVKIDPLTGTAHPVETDTLHYQLESGMVKRTTPAAPPGPAPVGAKPKTAEKHVHRHRGSKKGTGG